MSEHPGTLRVLSLDLEQRPELPDFQGPRWLPNSCPCDRVRVWQEELPADLSPYSHLMLSGSTCSVLDEHPFLPPLMTLVREAERLGLPILGICYGHQLLARTLLGDHHVRPSASPEIGWLPVRVLAGNEAMFAGLPNPFHTFVGHFDEVCDLPASWHVIASSENCEIQAFINRERKLMGFQFHPEMDLAVGNSCWAADRPLLEERGFDMDAVFATARDDGSGAVLIPRWLDLKW